MKKIYVLCVFLLLIVVSILFLSQGQIDVLDTFNTNLKNGIKVDQAENNKNTESVSNTALPKVQKLSKKITQTNTESGDADLKVFAYSNLSDDDEMLLMQDHQSLLFGMNEVNVKLSEFSETKNLENLQIEELQHWLDILYQNALLTRIYTESDMDDVSRDLINKILSDPLSPRDLELLKSKTSFLDNYYIDNLKTILSAVNEDSLDGFSSSLKLDYVLKIKKYFKQRKRHSDNHQISNMRNFLLDNSSTVTDKINYIERYSDMEDRVLSQYGKAYFIEQKNQNNVTVDEQKEISKFLSQTDLRGQQ